MATNRTETDGETARSPNEWIENKVAELLRKLRRSGFWESGIDEARHLQRTHGYAWDVALKISCDYWATS